MIRSSLVVYVDAFIFLKERVAITSAANNSITKQDP